MCFLENYPEIATVNIFIYFLPGYLSIYMFVHMFEQIWNHTEFLKYIFFNDNRVFNTLRKMTEWLYLAMQL